MFLKINPARKSMHPQKQFQIKKNSKQKKIQKYLAGEREGFSLVELIIVIAIMAILIGVIALAVIPNIQRSRESKDISFLDSVASATNAAIANNQVTGDGTLQTIALYAVNSSTGACNKATADSDATKAKIQSAVWKTIAENPTVGSSAAKLGTGVSASYVITSDGAATIIVYLTGASQAADKEDVTVTGTNKVSAVKCKYLSDPTSFYVKN